MITDQESKISFLEKKVSELEEQNRILSGRKTQKKPRETTAIPPPLRPYFDQAEELVSNYFSKLEMNPAEASIKIDNERYVLMRASSLSIDFLNKIKSLYSDKGETEAIRIGQNFLFDISHVIGLQDAKKFHEKLNLVDPIAKLSAGPVHFAYSGWSNVEILDGNPTSDEDFYLRYNHPSSFESESWIQSGKLSPTTVCTMNAGYSSGWCEESFDIPLTAVEITCRAKGDANCTFIMAHPSKIQEHLDKENLHLKEKTDYDIPLFFERKTAEQEIVNSLEEKSVLLKEIHHRVKNNLQLITSLLNLQSYHFNNEESVEMFNETKNRIKAIALVHEKLYKSSDVEHVNLKEYFQSIVNLLSDTFAAGQLISLNVNSSVNNKLTIDKAMPCGLILNELIANAIKYAFPDNLADRTPEILVTVSEQNQHYKIIVQDNGIGLPDNFSLDNTKSLGFEIILSLVDQIGGTINYSTERNEGSCLTIAFNN